MVVKVIYGCPCSGKSTYVSEHAEQNDIIFDYDAILCAITTRNKHLAERHIAHYVILQFRRSIINWAKKIKEAETFWFQCRWITDSIKEILQDMETEEIFISATKDECLERLAQDNSRPDKEAWESIINEWFDKFGKEENSDFENKRRNPHMNKFWNWVKNEDTGESELYLDGAISSETWYGDEITPAMFKSELKKHTGNITVWLNSPGGDVFAASQIYTMLRSHKGKITVKIDGIAASAASVVAMAGDETLISPTGMMMIHNPSTVAMGNKADMEKAISLLEEVKETILNAYEDKTHLSRTRLSHLMDEETWFNAKKAKQLGFVDGILFAERKLPFEEEPEEDEPEKEEESEKEEDKLPSMAYSPSRTMGSFLQKISADTTTGTPVAQLEKRLELLKY